MGSELAGQRLWWRDLKPGAKGFISLMVVLGSSVLLYGSIHQSSRNIAEFICYLGIAALTSRLRVKLPRIASTLSVSFLFILLGILQLSFSETLILGCAATLVHCIYPDRPSAIQVTFNLCSGAVSTALAYNVYHFVSPRFIESNVLALGVAATAYFVANTGSIAAVIALAEAASVKTILVECYFWSFPYYLAGAGVAGAIGWFDNTFNWETSLLIVPAIYVIYRSYGLYLGRLDAEREHVGEIANLHLRTIEALALAIEAKDHTTHDHLQRVRVYAIEVAKELGVGGAELEALHAAALLHDIGKLAVPEHIISKPGRLTPEEFEKMKIHPVVGAEILERVRFPYPVVPIVRAHHEKWDGSGYPYGLKGNEIPIGARILTAVDYLDALASDRQYRRALPLEEAMRRLAGESGRAFDPQVVDVLQKHYRQLEQRVSAQTVKEKDPQLSTGMKIERGLAPAAGFEKATATESSGSGEASFLSSIAAARQEAQALFELSQDLGASLSLGETLSVFSVKLRLLVPYDAIAIYLSRDEELVPEYVNGDNFRLFSSLRIPLGQGLSGWVAQNKKPIINGNPSVEPGYLNDPTKFSTLRSALAVPLEGVTGVIGVLALYRGERDAFTSDHLRILLAVSSKMALAIENALKYQQAESSATTDYLTGLPNARSLFLQLDRELARGKRDAKSLTVMVCDLDGFKKINDRFGHLEGNRVLRLFGQALKESCREYDYVARMGGDEFVLVAPGLTADVAAKKAEQLQQLAKQAGLEVCAEDILSLSVGLAIYPDDGNNAEQLLAEADRRMYMEKQRRPARKNRRVHARMKCRVTLELHSEGAEAPLFGNLTDISLGGCYVETSAVFAPGTKLKLLFSTNAGQLQVEGSVTRLDLGSGVAVQFDELKREGRDNMLRVLEFVQDTTIVYENQYLASLLKR